MKAEHQLYFQQRLQAERAMLLQRIKENERLGFDLSTRMFNTELSSYDNHPADYGDQYYEREKDSALLERSKQRVIEIEQALERLAEGKYGICQECGKEIPYERLDALPTASFCIDHSQMVNTAGKVVPGEGIRDQDNTYMAANQVNEMWDWYLDEIWDAVEQYGTSTSGGTLESKHEDVSIVASKMGDFTMKLPELEGIPLEGIYLEIDEHGQIVDGPYSFVYMDEWLMDDELADLMDLPNQYDNE
ncbi:TraR/DksA family transcriptional regulator [Rubeoparvulum massiliense]|uniref:TraR/DksA family transcriptional regulator n=1 Tax=Rubeoparvulum massiliense TaxID=1631346 RepID=UPI00065E4366|nr:TraR/DksA C4-type zinc finger protein [Rubeoparvulum massiliense]